MGAEDADIERTDAEVMGAAEDCEAQSGTHSDTQSEIQDRGEDVVADDVASPPGGQRDVVHDADVRKLVGDSIRRAYVGGERSADELVVLGLEAVEHLLRTGLEVDTLLAAIREEVLGLDDVA